MMLLVQQVRDFFADRGGPIVLAQVENELNARQQQYINWCGELAAKMDVNVRLLSAAAMTCTLLFACAGSLDHVQRRQRQQHHQYLVSPAVSTSFKLCFLNQQRE